MPILFVFLIVSEGFLMIKLCCGVVSADLTSRETLIRNDEVVSCILLTLLGLAKLIKSIARGNGENPPLMRRSIVLEHHRHLVVRSL